MKRNADERRFIVPGLLLGVGLGGFLDGILLHQLLQWHNMLSTVVPVTDVVTAKINMFWDGLFHLGTWVATLAGLLLLWREGKKGPLGSTSLLIGTLLLGWGIFNVVEGIIDHQILALHHVKPGDAQALWDLAFLVFGFSLCAVGISLIKPRALLRQPRLS